MVTSRGVPIVAAMRVRNASSWVCSAFAFGHLAVASGLFLLFGFGWMMYAADAPDGPPPEQSASWDLFANFMVGIGGLSAAAMVLGLVFRGGSSALIGACVVEAIGLAQMREVSPQEIVLVVVLAVVSCVVVVWDLCSPTKPKWQGMAGPTWNSARPG